MEKSKTEMMQTENAARMPEKLILINSHYCLLDSGDEEYHINWISCANMLLLLLLIGIKSGQNKIVHGFVIPPVLCVRGTLLEPHEGVASGAQRQASDPVSPLLLRTVTITKARQHDDRFAGFPLENDG